MRNFKSPQEALRYHVSGAVERGEKSPFVERLQRVDDDPRAPVAARTCSHTWQFVSGESGQCSKCGAEAH